MYRASLSAEHDGRRHAGLRASYWWFDLTVSDLGVSATVFDEDADKEGKEAALRELARVAHAYLRGEGHIEHRRGLARSHPVLRITVHDREWELGRRVSTVAYPGLR